MKPLIEITTVPISIEFKVNNARVEYKRSTAEVEISRDKSGLSMRSRPIKLNIDTFEARNSVIPSTLRSMDQYAQEGLTAAYEATGKFAEEGSMMIDIHLKQNTLAEIARLKMSQPAETNIAFLPEFPAEISWEPGDLSIQYEMDKLNFDLKLGKGDFKFTPGAIEFTIKQYPKVVIEYVGSPIYIPPSADPEYVAVDTKA